MTSFIREFGEFLLAVVNNWAGYTTGGVIVATVWLWSTLKQVPISRKVGILLAVMFLVFAFFNAWREQHHEALEKQQKLDALTLPILTADIFVAISRIGGNGGDTLMTVAGLIKNQGAPTVLDKWGVDIKFSDGRLLHGKLLLAPSPIDTLTLDDSKGHNPPMVLSGAKYWPSATRSQPIATGGGGDGWINALFPNLSADEVEQKKATIILTCRDVNGKEWPLQHTISAGDTPEIIDLRTLPGAKLENHP
jgi:hypothetical protein